VCADGRESTSVPTTASSFSESWVRKEELALAVHQHRVRLSPQPGRRREPESVPEILQRATQQRRPGRTGKAELVRHREVHDRAGTPEEFTRRLHDLREQHRGKPSLMRRFTDAGLTAR
jgi:hypothetical protein